VAIERLPEVVRTPSVVRAGVSPSAVVAAGAGVAIGLAAGLPALATAALAASCWGIRVAAAAVAARRRERAGRPKPVDPYAVPEPWRTFVRQSLSAQAKFGEAVAQCRPGPLQDRLQAVAGRVDEGVRECWRIAHLGASMAAALRDLDPDDTSRQLGEVQEQRRRLPARGPGVSAESIDQTEAALAARLQTARRMQSVVQRATDRLLVLTAQLGGAVASAVELSLDASDPAAAQPLAGDIDTVVGEIEALRQAMEETEGAPTTGSATKP
jgi:hypothetical protein